MSRPAPGVPLLLATVLSAACNSDFGIPEAVNVAPLVRINAPDDGEVVEAFDTVEFRGTVVDDNGRDDLDVVAWYSDLDGDLGDPDRVFPDPSGQTFLATQLSPGAHTVTLEAVDAQGLVAADSITVVVGAAITDPTVEILSPDDFDEFDLGDDVDFVGVVSDPDGPVAALWVTWTWVNTAGGTPAVLFEGNPATNGITTADWLSVPAGTFQVELTVEDLDGNLAAADIFIEVIDPDDLDLDLDGWTTNGGDCDDDDGTVYPGAPELCDSKDNDCNFIVDDKDDDLDFHIDEACPSYDGGIYPVDDCDDGDGTVYSGAPELEDGQDNDCDDEIDEGTNSYDDDGDCFCEGPGCIDSIDPSCISPLPGDCDDTDPATNPGAFDVPDGDYYDDNCDGIDGDKATAVFVSTAGANNPVCDFAAPCRNIAHAISIAGTRGLSQVYVRAGGYPEVVVPFDDLEIFGGYNAAWVRAPVTIAAHDTRLEGGAWSGQSMSVRAESVLNVLLADVHIKAPDGSGTVGIDGKASYGLYAVSATLVIERAKITGGRGADGGDGGDGASWPSSDRADGGDSGENAYQLGTFVSCDDGRQDGGAGGYEAACGLTWGDTRGGTGGDGGQADQQCGWCGCWPCGECNDSSGQAGTQADYSPGTPGNGGNGGGTCTATAPQSGQPGAIRNGGAGPAGDRDGRLSGNHWTAGSGGVGTLGYNGGGGGGGGGSGGCDNGNLGSDSAGAGGGGGGSGGCRNANPGAGGGGGGGSFGVFAISSTVSVFDSDFFLGIGGTGGEGGSGGAGQPGGLAGQGGGSATGVREGGDGGPGAHGGHAGGGGGGAGGSVYGIYSYGSAVFAPAGNTYSPGTVGQGGDGGVSAPGWSDGNDGVDGQDGVQANTGTCQAPLGC